MPSPRVLTETSRANTEPAAFAVRPSAVVAAAAMLSLVAIGCGPSRPAVVPVCGIVTLDGKPLAGGFVRAVPADSRAATGRIGPDGRFALGTVAEADGCVPGTHGVEVIGPLPAGGEMASATPAPTVTVPAHYRAAETSGLTITVTGSTSDLAIALSTEN